MATIQNTIEGIKSDISSTFKNLSNGVQDKFNSIIGTISSSASGIYGGDVVGINIDEIPNMQQAIRDYVAAIDSHLDEVNKNADTANAYKGEFATAVKSYVEAVCQACGALTSQLLQFNETLEEVKTKYMSHDEDVKAQLSGQSAEINSSFTRYTE